MKVVPGLGWTWRQTFAPAYTHRKLLNNMKNDKFMYVFLECYLLHEAERSDVRVLDE